jgi:WD40 repeat protein
VTTIATVASSTKIISASYDSRVVVWDLATGHELATLGAHHNQIYAVTVTQDGRYALSAGADKAIKIWNVATGELERVFKGHNRIVHAVAVSAGGMVASSGDGGRLHLWDLATANALGVINTKAPDVNFLEFLDAGRVLSAGADGKLMVWHLPNSASERIGPVRDALTALAVSASRRLVVVGTESGALFLHDLARGSERALEPGHAGAVFTAAISPDGTKAITGGGGADGRVRLWELGSGALLATIDLRSARDYVHSVAFVPDGKSFLVGTFRGPILRFELR